MPGSAMLWMRDAVLTRSPATMPSPCAPTVTAASPVSTPTRSFTSAPSSSDEAGDGGDEIEPGAHRALGVVLVRGRRSPDRHDCVADELLDGAAVALDEPAACIEVAREQLAHFLGVARLGERREADEVGEEHGDEAALGDALGRRARARAPPTRLWPHSSQKLLVGGDRRAAGRAGEREACAAGAAEPGTGPVFGLASWTVHPFYPSGPPYPGLAKRARDARGARLDERWPI